MTKAELVSVLRACVEEMKLIEDAQSCDHSVGICWCSWRAALEKADRVVQAYDRSQKFMAALDVPRKDDMPPPDVRARVNAGLQCPECLGPNTKAPRRGQYICDDCGCQWDRRRYPSLVVREEPRR